MERSDFYIAPLYLWEIYRAKFTPKKEKQAYGQNKFRKR